MSLSKNTRLYTFDVEGMTCSACVKHVQQAAEGITGVQSADVNLLTHTLRIQAYPHEIGPSFCTTVVDTLKSAGYDAQISDVAGGAHDGVADAAANSVTATPGSASDAAAAVGVAQKHSHSTPAGSDLRELSRLAHRLKLSILCAVPLMYLAMAPMFGLPCLFSSTSRADYALGGLIQFFLALCILIINRVYFIRGFKAARAGYATMDTLIALGSLASFVYSTFLVGLRWFDVFAFLHYAEHVFSLPHAQQSLTEALPAFVSVSAAFPLDHLYFDSCGMILVFVSIGTYFETKTKQQATSALTELINLVPPLVTVVTSSGEKLCSRDSVQVGQEIIVKAGERIALDATVVAGSLAVDESALSGEAFPQDKTLHSKVYAGTHVLQGWARLRVDTVASQSVLSHIITLVEQATSTKAPIERIADTLASLFVPAVILISLVTFVTWLLLAGAVSALPWAINCAVSVLVVSCPCALGLAVPVALMVACARGARFGILFKCASALENLRRVRVVAFDKTGTLTRGKPCVTAHVVLDELSNNQQAYASFLRDVWMLEHKSEHVVARALCLYIKTLADKHDIELSDKTCTSVVDTCDFTQQPGLGVTGYVRGRRLVIGNERLMHSLHIDITQVCAVLPKSTLKSSVIYVAYDTCACACFEFEDLCKPSSIEALAALRTRALEPVMLSGDTPASCEQLARQLSIKEVHAGLLPNEKYACIKNLQNAVHVRTSKLSRLVGFRSYPLVAMVGDGINDAPSLAQADIGIAVGAGTDIAIDSADIVLMNSNVCDLVHAYDLSKKTARIIKQNLFWALVYNVICIPLAAGVFQPFSITFNPMMASASMSISSLIVVGNALRLLRWKPRALSKITPTSREHSSTIKEKISVTHKETRGTHKEKTVIIKLAIEGMTCEHCVRHVTDALSEVAGVSKVDVSLACKSAEVVCSDAQISQQLIAAVEKAGYSAHLM